MRDRTADLLNANQALSQLSYSPALTCYLIAWLRALLGPTFGAAPHSIGHLPDVSSLTRSSRALHRTQNPALKTFDRLKTIEGSRSQAARETIASTVQD